MGWFWAEPSRRTDSRALAHHSFTSPDSRRSPPPGCPMHKSSAQPINEPSCCSEPNSTPSACPVPHEARGCPVPHEARGCPVPHEVRDSLPTNTAESPTTLSKLNPLNWMFSDLSQDRAPSQTYHLPTSRDPSTIPRGDGTGNWEYPSPQQMYNAMLRKGYTDTDVTAVESMVSVHNFLNEGAWQEIMEWEKRFSGGLYQGMRLCSRGEQNFESTARKYGLEKGIGELQPSLVRFQGRPKDMTPKATMIQVMGWIYPTMFGTEPPFDRHDWYVSREINGQKKEVRYIIDYYSGGEENGEPVFYLDVRPAMTPTGAVERAIRWGGDVWWKASGGDVREMTREKKARSS